MDTQKELAEIRSQISELSDRLLELSDDSADIFTDRVRAGKKKAERAIRDVADYATENPGQVIGIAAAAATIGMVVAGLFNSKRRNRD